MARRSAGNATRPGSNEMPAETHDTLQDKYASSGTFPIHKPPGNNHLRLSVLPRNTIRHPSGGASIRAHSRRPTASGCEAFVLNDRIINIYSFWLLHLPARLSYSGVVASIAKSLLYAEGDRALSRDVSDSLPVVAISLIIHVIVRGPA